MKATGIICEYNPLHLGHFKQLQLLRQQDPDGAIVCLMSGNFVQRGEPAILDKTLRARAAVLCGADLVLQMPVTASLCSAEGFASKGVAVLSGFCQQLSFGAETARKDTLLETAGVLLRQDFSDALRTWLEKGLSFPAARQAAAEALGAKGDVLTHPNDILGVEYCKAILSQKSAMEPVPISRAGDYHAREADAQAPSATAVRTRMLRGESWDIYVPESARSVFAGASLHALSQGEQAILYRLRTMSDSEFEALPYGSEGLWRKLMKSARKEATLEAILTATKSKRYTRSRLDRMVMCAFLGLTEDGLAAPVPYTRALAFNEKGRAVLKTARETGLFPNAGESLDHPFQAVETRCEDLYGLFALNGPEAPGGESACRIFNK